MGREGSCPSSPSPSSCSPNGKRSRDASEDEIFLDNFHSHKRYLSEVAIKLGFKKYHSYLYRFSQCFYCLLVDSQSSQFVFCNQIMACSLNGLSVGESLSENLMEYPARSDSSICFQTRYHSLMLLVVSF